MLADVALLQASRPQPDPLHQPVTPPSQLCVLVVGDVRRLGVSADGALADFTQTIQHLHGAQPAPSPPLHPLACFPSLLCSHSNPPILSPAPVGIQLAAAEMLKRAGCLERSRSGVAFATASGVLHWGTVAGGRRLVVPSVRSRAWEGLAAILCGRTWAEQCVVCICCSVTLQQKEPAESRK